MFRALSIFLIGSSIVFAKVCDSGQGSIDFQNFKQLAKETSLITQDLTCEMITKVKSREELKAMLLQMLKSQLSRVPKNDDRYEVMKALNSCSPSDNSKALVISFAGTGAYNPRTHHLLGELLKCDELAELNAKVRSHSYHRLYSILKESQSDIKNWSGIDRGFMNMLIKDDTLRAHAKNFDFATFPSEEHEELSEADYSLGNVLSLAGSFVFSSGEAKGVKAAVECTRQYLKHVRERGIHPKLIVISHSSGGRSVAKYLKEIEKTGVQSDLTLTIDPVKEAHLALKEVYEQRKNDNPTVWSRSQKNLYKLNSKRWINFYQQKDKEGLKGPIKFGIQGSPVHGADKNIHLKDNLGDGAHGEITYHSETLETIKTEVLNLDF